MAIGLKPEERDAIFTQITADLGLFRDLENAIEAGNEEECYRLARVLSDGLRLLLDGGLGWRSKTVEPSVLTLPDQELVGIMGRLQNRMVVLYENMRPDRERAQAPWDEIALIRDRCGEVAEEARNRS